MARVLPADSPTSNLQVAWQELSTSACLSHLSVPIPAWPALKFRPQMKDTLGQAEETRFATQLVGQQAVVQDREMGTQEMDEQAADATVLKTECPIPFIRGPQGLQKAPGSSWYFCCHNSGDLEWQCDKFSLALGLKLAPLVQATPLSP